MTELMLIDFGAALGRTNERFQVRWREKPAIEFAAMDISHIIIAGKGMSLSADAIAFAVEQQIPITLFSFSGEPYARLSTNHEMDDALLRREQIYATADPRGTAIARALIHGKLRNQAATLRYFAKSRKKFDNSTFHGLVEAANAIFTLARDVKERPGADMEEERTTIMAVEAQGARQYWQALARVLPEDLHFVGRAHKGASDPVNVSLNYGYGILYSRVWTAIAKARLDPYAGFLHALQEGRPALVYDMVEPFRSWVVDRPNIAAFLKKWQPHFEPDLSLTQESRKTIAKRILEQFDQRFCYHKKMTRTEDIMMAQAREIASFLRNNTPIKPFIAPW